ncbi:hypothetical protein J1614_009583 [Plenodomus biglobosus]|nr:hypothetical protein J1614_009583 [Plenodomus biglobosus]
MHRKNPISVLVYNSLFPTPSPTDPPSFSAHLSKNLVGEVRVETANFYGSLDTIEARYPGLNYAFAPHRKRLGRFPHHRRLFEAFDRLGLTEAEIQGFCRWEGTLWARERYERDEGVRVEDTTGVEIKEWIDRRGQRSLPNSSSSSSSSNEINVKTDIEVEIEQVHNNSNHNSISTTTHPTDRRTSSSRAHHQHQPSQSQSQSRSQQQHQQQSQHPHHHDTEMPDSSSTTTPTSSSDSDSDTEPSLHTSIGFSLNARLLHAAALREQGANVSMDPEWEQYLKEAQERGELNIDATREALRTMAGQIAHLHQHGHGHGHEILVQAQQGGIGVGAADASAEGVGVGVGVEAPVAPA